MIHRDINYRMYFISSAVILLISNKFIRIKNGLGQIMV